MERVNICECEYLAYCGLKFISIDAKNKQNKCDENCLVRQLEEKQQKLNKIREVIIELFESDMITSLGMYNKLEVIKNLVTIDK